MNAYIAAPFFNEAQLKFVVSIESYLHENEIKFFSPRSEGILMNMSKEEKEKALKNIFDSNIEHMDKCDFMIAVIDDWDTGTVFEIGYAFGQKIPVFTISNYNYGLNVMIREAVTVHNKNVQNLIANIKQFIDGEELTIFTELTKDVI